MRAAIYDGDTRGRAALADPQVGERRPLQPRHAPRRRAAAPRPLGRRAHNLRYVVVDEAHVYRGVFGSHVGNVLRRLRRLARVYGAEPQFLLASATIANPGELAPRLSASRSDRRSATTRAPRAERDDRALEPGAARRGARPARERARRRVAADGRARLARAAHALLREEPKGRRADPPLHGRAGRRRDRRRASLPTAPATRRHSGARSSGGWSTGELLGVAATDALELGIDIGLLDCAISVGFPGTVAILRQQWGRAGRRGHGLAVLVASEDALDQYFMREPETLLGRRVEAAILDHANPRVLDGHVRAAAFEAPLDDADRATLGDEALERAALLPELQRTRPVTSGPAATTRPRAVRSARHEPGHVLGRRSDDRHRARHRRARARVLDRPRGRRLPPPRRGLPRARARPRSAARRSSTPFTGDWYTQAKKETTTAIERAAARRAAARARPDLRPRLGHGAGRRVPGRSRSATQETLDLVALDLPETTLRDGGDLVLSRGRAARGPRPDAEAPRHAARRRARDDRAAAALGDVRPLGHRRALDEHPLPDRTRRRCSSTTATPAASASPSADSRRSRAGSRTPRRCSRAAPASDGCPSCVQTPEVRQPERDARQGRGARRCCAGCAEWWPHQHPPPMAERTAPAARSSRRRLRRRLRCASPRQARRDDRQPRELHALHADAAGGRVGNARAAPRRRPAPADVPARRAPPRPRRRRSTPRAPSRSRPRTERSTVGYEQLVVALGAVSRTLPIPGLAEHGLGFKDLADAIHLRNHVLRHSKRRGGDRRRPTPSA